MTPAPASRPAVLRRLPAAAAGVFAAWHLLVLAVRNPVDQWPGLSAAVPGWLDAATRAYADRLGVEQGWPLFAVPVWRNSPFPAVRLEFSDGTCETVLSPNEPADPADFVRLGGGRDRRLDDHLAAGAGSLPDTREFPLWRAVVRRAVADWRRRNPDDPRVVQAAVVVIRDHRAPPPGSDDRTRTVTVHDAGRFTPEGEWK